MTRAPRAALVSVVAALALVSACRSRSQDASPPPSSSPPSSSSPSADVTPAEAAGLSAAPKLPGALYFRVGDGLAKLADGVFVTDFAVADAQLFPSEYALPDGRVVGIASTGTGEAGSEQLVLIGPGTAIERIGPANTQVRNPAVDPAGTWIVIESKVEPHSELYRIDLATQQSTQLTDNAQGNFTPAVLDGKSLVFASSRDGDSEIYKLDLATKQPTRLTAFHRDDWSPRPSPDGPNRSKTIAFLSDREGPPHIFLVDADGTHLRRLTTDADEEAEPTWSPDGTSIAFTRAGKLVVRDVARAGRASRERVLTPTDASDAEPAWSRDGDWIAVTRTPKRAGSSGTAVSDIWAIPLAGGDPIAVTSGANARLPRWH